MLPCCKETVILASSTNMVMKSLLRAYCGRICFTTMFFSKPSTPYILAL